MYDNNYRMTELMLKVFVKYIAIKVDIFESEIIDEQNFDTNDVFGIMRFKHKYNRDDHCMVIEIEM